MNRTVPLTHSWRHGIDRGRGRGVIVEAGRAIPEGEVDTIKASGAITGAGSHVVEAGGYLLLTLPTIASDLHGPARLSIARVRLYLEPSLGRRLWLRLKGENPHQ